MRALWDFARLEDKRVLPNLNWLNRSGLLRGKVGIECPRCRTKFRVEQTRIYVVRAVVGLCILGGAWVIAAETGIFSNRQAGYVVAATAVLSYAWFTRYFTPYLARAGLVRPNEQLSYPLKSAYEGPSDSPSP
jgi:hypothetical protein